jgi:hypothetical protein
MCAGPSVEAGGRMVFVLANSGTVYALQMAP